MTGEEFINVLRRKDYTYSIEGDKIVVLHNGGAWLDKLKSIPSAVEFRNGGGVDLSSLEELPSGVVFRNTGYVNLDSLKKIPQDFEFMNGGTVYSSSLFFGPFSQWKGNIEGISSRILLNLMIKRELFI